MKRSVKTNKVLVLELGADEARWLRDISQNYLGESRDDESSDNRDIRHEMFKATYDFLNDLEV